MTATAFATPWLAEEDFDEISKESAGGQYVNPSKLEADKEHRFRFIGAAITGFETWTDDKKPVRFRMKPSASELPPNVKLVDGKPQIKRFVATLVWDYQTESFRILQMTQKSIMQDINKFNKDSDYGDPQGYDIKITRTGSGMDTEYATVAAPPKALASDIKKQAADFFCNLDAMFDNKDPFEKPAA